MDRVGGGLYTAMDEVVFFSSPGRCWRLYAGEIGVDTIRAVARFALGLAARFVLRLASRFALGFAVRFAHAA